MLPFTIAASIVTHSPVQGPLKTPYAQRAPLEIRSVVPRQTVLRKFDLWEAEVDLRAAFDNPFDPDDISLRAVVTTPSGGQEQVFGYIDRPISATLVENQEVLDPDGPTVWKLRYAPREIGVYRLQVSVTDQTGKSVNRSVAFEATAPDSNGFVRTSPRDRRFFEYTNGKSYFPVGTNLAWASGKGSQDIENWLNALARTGGNYARVWLSPANLTFALETVGAPSVGKGLGTLDLGNAWRLDQALALAQKKNIHLMVTIDSSQVLEYRNATSYWGKTPHNLENGGPLRIWSEFWTQPRMDKIYKNKLRYLVARYGAFRSVFAWEFWADVDQVHDFQVDVVRDWHQRMAKVIREMDPYGHLITTSTSNPYGIRDLDLLPDLDLAQTHYYGADPALMVAIQQSRKANWGKPHFVSEIGADDSSSRSGEDIEGVQVHDPMWASIATGVAGAAAPWYWDSLVETNKLFPLFASVAKFVEDVDFPGEAFQQVHPGLAFAEAKTRMQHDLNVPQAEAIWEDSPLNRPKTVSLRKGEISGPLVSPILHGQRNHRTWHNPVLFKLSLNAPTRFEVEVGNVSGFGGAILRIELDGERILTRKFEDPDDMQKSNLLTQYRGVYAITVPAGYHTVKVANIGNDWFEANYRFLKAGPPTTRPPLESFGVVGNSVAMAWLRVEGRTWQRVVALRRKLPGSTPAVMRLDGLASGAWRVSLWDTWKGKVIKSFPIAVGLNGMARIPIPFVEQDIAIKLVRSAAFKGR